jgi:hypothetical protein
MFVVEALAGDASLLDAALGPRRLAKLEQLCPAISRL